jgi:hypothetical protein
MSIKGAFYPINLLSHDEDPDWKVARYPFTDAAPEVIGKMLAGFLVKFNATLDAVLPALAADDAALGGIIVDLPDPTDLATAPTVLVALSGSFNKKQIHYANAWSQGSSPTPLSVAAITRLRDINIYVDDTIAAGKFAP